MYTEPNHCDRQVSSAKGISGCRLGLPLGMHLCITEFRNVPIPKSLYFGFLVEFFAPG